MGQRLRKFIGYGLSDVRCADAKITDPRINPESPLLRSSMSLKASDYLGWLADNRSKDNYLDYATLRDWERAGDERLTKTDLYGTIACDTEYGLPNVLVLRPLSCPDWSRSDSDIDRAMDEAMGFDAPQPWVRHLRDGIFPFSRYMDRTSGERITSNRVMDWIRARNDARFGELFDLEELARELGYASNEEAGRQIVPGVPEEIRDLARYGELFSDPDAWRGLRPMLYSWWA